MGESLLTVIVPVHNISNRMKNLSSWIPEAILENIEIILVHDESQDSTKSELERLLKENNSGKISLIEVNVQSPGLARNAGLDMITTPWYSFADADDFVCVPNLIQLLHETIECKSALGMGSYLAINSKNGEEQEFAPPQASDRGKVLELANRMGLWRLVFSTQSSGDVRFSSHRMAEDYLYINQVLNRSEKVHSSTLLVYKYYFGGISNLTSNKMVMSDMFGVLEGLKKAEFEGTLALKFQSCAIQKLTLSILKNAPISIVIRAFPTLLKSLLFDPTSLVLLLTSKQFRKVGVHEN